MTTNPATDKPVTPPEDATPEHQHEWDWESAGNYAEDGLAGVRCSYSWQIPPGPRGKKPRTRTCNASYDMDTVLDAFTEWEKSR